jgi:hypothetical protein
MTKENLLEYVRLMTRCWGLMQHAVSRYCIFVQQKGSIKDIDSARLQAHMALDEFLDIRFTLGVMPSISSGDDARRIPIKGENNRGPE